MSNQQQAINKAETPPQQPTIHQCRVCQANFASRNLLFDHLRTTDTCGGAAIGKAPSVMIKQAKKQTLHRRKTGRTMEHVEHSCWMGDLPLYWTRHGGKYKNLRLLLYEFLPRDIYQPWIKTVTRKAYKRNGIYLGFAIVVFRDQEELDTVLSLSGSRIVPQEILPHEKLPDKVVPFSIKVLPRKERIKSQFEKPSTPGLDPPLLDQLKPIRTELLLERLGETVPADAGAASTLIHDAVLARAVEWYETPSSTAPRQRHVHHTGRLIPDAIRNNLLQILQTLRWRVPNEREGLTAERYLVLTTNNTHHVRFYKPLLVACQKLMDWVDPNYSYSGIAVTKNFLGSPHIDDRDQSFQYAVSLGDFDGGQLCVEDGCCESGQRTVHVVNTRNRVARVDGRHVHWVRTFCGGDRYSLIFFDTSDKFPTAVMESGVDESYCEPAVSSVTSSS